MQLLYAFPNLLARLEPTLPLTFAHHKKIAESKRIKEYLASDRRVAFNENGMFRHYPELDPKEEEVEGTEK